MKDKSPELEVAIKAALEAGKILEKYFVKFCRNASSKNKSESKA